MDLRVSVVLLFFFFTGGYSLQCYSCSSEKTGFCEAKVEACLAGFSKCGKTIVENSVGSSKVSYTAKGCTPKCDPGTQKNELGTVSLHCCDTDLCNTADGVFKGSFLLLFSPLLFYFLFQ
ncbi:lymphocyte antigen 6E-like [Megalobrama amblycephala]|uniref:lymphocyte antigen 6E-like n=1 Tax=Megalobrama amblycephala TaxID=75352 RepID=UPI0020142658|nr:lymphocyte antigen 6E-like [Megalobrama amblycephala]